MPNVLYVGRCSALAAAAAARVREGGHGFALACPRDAQRHLRRRGGCGAIVMCWCFTKTSMAVAKAARKLGIPLIVVTDRMIAAFRAFDSLADIFLEQPASAEEVATLAIELMNRAEAAKGSVAPAAKPLVAATAA